MANSFGNQDQPASPGEDSAAELDTADGLERHFKMARVLAGFMPIAQWQQFSQLHVSSLSVPNQEDVLATVAASRLHAATLPEVELAGGLLEPFESMRIHALLESGQLSSFSGQTFSFAWIDPRKVVATQVFANHVSGSFPSDADELIDLMLPATGGIPIEISASQNGGSVYVYTSSPHLTSYDIQAQGAVVMVQPRGHVNLVQVADYNDRLYLKNGTHRITRAIAAGAERIPALVVEVAAPVDTVPGIGPGVFASDQLVAAPRPPLIAVFASLASVDLAMRDARYGYVVSVTPLRLPI